MSNLAEALAYAARGWRVLPCDPSPGEWAKAPIGVLVPHGVLDATVDVGQLTRWWAARPDALIGGRVPDGLFVLDTDPRSGGHVKSLEDAYGALPPTPTVLSGRGDGGRHLYFTRPGETPLSTARLKRAGWGGFDVKTSSGYAILPPSLHPDTGQPYVWSEWGQPAAAPAWLVDLLTPLLPEKAPTGRTRRGGPARRWDGLLRQVERAADGDQNFRIFWAAKRAATEGAPEQWFAELARVAVAANHPPTRVRRAIESGRLAGSGEVVSR